jgi:type VI secretion system FHA domain protein
MNLTLEVVSSNGQGLGVGRRTVFGPEGGRIGRALDCEWVLANPYISRHHATVRCIDGAYYIESTGENRVAVNSPQASIPPFKPQELHNGDRIYLDEYEIAVILDIAQFAPMPTLRSSRGREPPADSFDDLEPTQDTPGFAGPYDPLEEDVDPLGRFQGGSRAPAPDRQPEMKPSWNHTPGLNDHYAPPPVPAASSYGAAIPEGWDRTSFGRNNAVSNPSPAPGERNSAVLGGEIPENWAETGLGMGKAVAKPAPPSPRPGPSAVPPAPASEGVDRPPRPAGRRSGPTQRIGHPAASMPPRPPGGPSAAQAPEEPWRTAAPAAFDVQTFLQAAGLDPAAVPSETAAALGEILRTVIQGMVEVLHSRVEVKDQFRMPVTRVMTKDNNPLKFAVNADSALAFLLGRRDPAYLPPVEAVEDAMSDIRFHQLAMLSGMRAGFDHMLKYFEPSHLQQLFDRSAKRGGLLGIGSKTRYWERYTEEYGELVADPEAAFRRVFGDAFAKGYEKQLNTLRTSHGKLRR